MSFEQVLDLLESAEIVVIVTASSTGERAATPIWAVVVDGVPYIRSYLGTGGRWYRRAACGSPTWFTLGDGRVAERDRAAALLQPQVAVRLERVPADAAVQTLISAAMARKYHAQPQEVAGINDAKALACTFRVVAS